MWTDEGGAGASADDATGAGAGAPAKEPHRHATLLQAFEAELAAAGDDPDKLAALGETLDDLGDRIAVRQARAGPCFNDCSLPEPILLANRRIGGWRHHRLHCRGCGVTWRRVWVSR